MIAVHIAVSVIAFDGQNVHRSSATNR